MHELRGSLDEAKAYPMDGQPDSLDADQMKLGKSTTSIAKEGQQTSEPNFHVESNFSLFSFLHFHHTMTLLYINVHFSDAARF